MYPSTYICYAAYYFGEFSFVGYTLRFFLRDGKHVGVIMTGRSFSAELAEPWLVGSTLSQRCKM